MTKQAARDAQAHALARAWAQGPLAPGQVYAKLTQYASLPEHRDLAAHLVTACRERGLLGSRA